jgi:alpha-galactosidase
VVGLEWAQFFTAHLKNTHAAQTANQLTPEELYRHAAQLALSPDQVMWRATAQPGLTDTEQRTHFSLWAMLAAPLIAGNDIRSMTEQTRAILTNRDVIAVDQDPLVVQATAVPTDSRVLVKPLAGGDVAVALFNPDSQPAAIATTASAVGLRNASCYTVRDLWTHAESHTTGEISGQPVPAHGVVMLRISPACG